MKFSSIILIFLLVITHFNSKAHADSTYYNPYQEMNFDLSPSQGLVKCLQERLDKKRGLRVAQEASDAAVLKDLYDKVLISKRICIQENERNAEKYFEKEADYILREALQPREFIILKTCARDTQYDVYNMSPCDMVIPPKP